MKRFFFLFVLGLMLACQPDSVFSDPIIELHPEPAVQEPEPEEYSFVVLGDSYSAYSGSVPSGYLTWYPHSDNNVSELSQMWWSLLEARPGYTMLYNSSYSGSTICNTGYNGENSSVSSFVTRMKKDIVSEDGYAGRCKTIPDLVLILGGTNDYWAGSPFGKVVPNSCMSS